MNELHDTEPEKKRGKRKPMKKPKKDPPKPEKRSLFGFSKPKPKPKPDRDKEWEDLIWLEEMLDDDE